MVTLGWMYLAESNALYLSILIPFVVPVSDTYKTKATPVTLRTTYVRIKVF